MPAGNHGSCIHHNGLGICFDEYNSHDSLQARLIEGHVGHKPIGKRQDCRIQAEIMRFTTYVSECLSNILSDYMSLICNYGLLNKPLV